MKHIAAVSKTNAPKKAFLGWFFRKNIVETAIAALDKSSLIPDYRDRL